MTALSTPTASKLQPMTADGVHCSLDPADAVLYVKTDADSLNLHENADTRMINAHAILDALAEMADQGFAQKADRDPKLDTIQSLAFAALMMLAEAKELYFYAHESDCKERGRLGYADESHMILPANASTEVLHHFMGNKDLESARVSYEALRKMLAERRASDQGAS